MTEEFGWMDGVAPPLPGYSDIYRLRAIVDGIKAEIESYLRSSIERLEAPEPLSRIRSELWLAALYAHRYGVIYWLNRHDARALRSLAIDHAEPLNTLGEY